MQGLGGLNRQGLRVLPGSSWVTLYRPEQQMRIKAKKQLRNVDRELDGKP